MKKILLVVANYYQDISKGLIQSAKKKFSKNYIFDIKEVPGVFEIPVVISKHIKRYDVKGYLVFPISFFQYK